MSDLPVGTVTLLFTDIEGSTKLLQRLGERYASLLADYRQLVRSEMQKRHGFEVDTQGDAFFVAFARAGDAVLAAIDVQKALFAHAWPEAVTLCVRMGLHTGEPQRAAEGYVGLDVHRAARIMSVAHGGQVLLSQTTRALVEHDLPEAVQMRDVGVHHLKDMNAPERLFQLVTPGLPTDFPPLKTAGRQRQLHHVPVPPTSFIGREQQVEAISELLRRPDVRLLTLTGAAGVGKTRLALQVVSAISDLFADGVYFVALDQVSEAAGVLPTLAQALGIREETGSALIERLKDALREKHLLLILDNFEQVIDAALTVSELLASSSGLKLLVTSRIVLHVRAERVFDILPLAVPASSAGVEPAALARYESIMLFVQRAQAVRPDFQLTHANAAAVVAICVRLDGVPLAIELAAARSRYLSPQSLLQQLEQGLNTLAAGTRDAPERQQTLRGAIAWSYKLLSEIEQGVFRRLAVCISGCTLDAAERICEGIGGVESLFAILEALVDKSLLRYQQQDREEARFWMLQTLREYGLECLAHEGETATARSAHALYYLAWMEQVAPYLVGAEQTDWLDRVAQEYENIRAALHWMLSEAATHTQEEQAEWAGRAMRLCAALSEFWEVRGYFNEGSRFLERALAVGEGVTPSVRAEAIYNASFLALVKGDGQRAEELMQQSQLLFRENGDKRGMANILRMQGNLAYSRSAFKLARRLLQEALVIYQELDDQASLSYMREDLTQLFMVQGDYSRARELIAENLAYFEARGERHQRAYPLYSLARILYLSRGAQEQVWELAEESLTLFNEARNRRHIAHVSRLLGLLHLQKGEESEARSLIEESLATLKELESTFSVCSSLLALARVLMVQGDISGSCARYEEGWHLIRKLDAQEYAASCLEGMGEAVASQDMAERAIYLWGAAATIRANVAAPMPPVYRASYLQALKRAREQVSEEGFALVWSAGRQWLLDQESALPQEIPDNEAANLKSLPGRSGVLP